MIRTLLLLRHAKSSWKEPSLADHDRPLNSRGRRDADRLGRLLLEQHELPDLILSSTAKRAAKTVKRLIKTSGYDGPVEWRDELYLADPRAFVTALQNAPDSCHRVLIVGHNPGLETFLDQLTETDEALPTAALARVELELDSWRQIDEGTRGTLSALWLPRELDAL